MVEVRGHEADGRVAVITSICTWDVPRILTGRGRPVVTTPARTDHLQMIYLRHRRKYRGRMTVLTDACRRDMADGLADGAYAIVTDRTVARDAVVTKRRWRKADRRVADVAGVTARNMASCLAGRRQAVVTAHASP